MRTLGALLVVALVATATLSQSSPFRRPVIGSLPQLNTASTAGVGEALFAQFSLWERDAVKTVDNTAPGGRVLPAGTALFTSYGTYGKQRGQQVWCWYRDAGGTALTPLCFGDADGDGRLDGQGPQYNIRPFRSGSPQIAVEPTVVIEEHSPIRGESWRKELLYQGVSGTTLRLLYREFLDDMARPAFSQDLTYELAKDAPTAVSFRAVRISVESAGNDGMRYTVLSGFGEP